MLGFAPISALPISGLPVVVTTANIVAVGIPGGEAVGSPALQRESLNVTGGGGGKTKRQKEYKAQELTLRLIGIKSAETLGRPSVSAALSAKSIEASNQIGQLGTRKRWIAKDEELLIAA
jgi:hypothetical protein